jgi:hypothetical protein
MPDVFEQVPLPFEQDTWGIQLFHEDTDTGPRCFVVLSTQSNEVVELEFFGATYACARPHRDNEEIGDVTGYTFPKVNPWDSNGSLIFVSRSSSWISRERENWKYRLRGSPSLDDLRHFLIDGRDGYVEILASNLNWRLWPSWDAHRKRVDPDARGSYPAISNEELRGKFTQQLSRLVDKLQRDANLKITYSVLPDQCAAVVTYSSGREVTISGDIAGMTWGDSEYFLMRQLVAGLRAESEGIIKSPWPPCPHHAGSHALEPDYKRTLDGLSFDAEWFCPETQSRVSEFGWL